MADGIGEGLGAMLDIMFFLLVVQIPFSVIGIWTCLCWIGYFINHHWRW